jgi:hypothetical protein
MKDEAGEWEYEQWSYKWTKCKTANHAPKGIIATPQIADDIIIAMPKAVGDLGENTSTTNPDKAMRIVIPK